jgi:DNA-binding transcriptional ArsR family regulator
VRPDPRVALLKELAHPLRLRVIDRLGHLGPASVSALAAELGATMPELSNHLRRLRAAGLVRAGREGRHAIYELAGPEIDVLLPLLDRLTAPAAPEPARARSRTCYDHLAGPLGVRLYRDLRTRGALRAARDGTVEVTDPAPLAALGADPAEIEPGRRRLAFECLDATEQQPHLAGALGAALAAAMFDRGWIERTGARELRLTEAGRAAL